MGVCESLATRGGEGRYASASAVVQNRHTVDIILEPPLGRVTQENASVAKFGSTNDSPTRVALLAHFGGDCATAAM